MNASTMTRWELVNALRSYAPPQKYQRLISGPTALLRAALAYYSSPESERGDGAAKAPHVIITIEHVHHG